MALPPSLHRAFYRQRVQGNLVENTVENPASAATWSGGECPSVPRSFLNEANCQLLLGCAPLQLLPVSASPAVM